MSSIAHQLAPTRTDTAAAKLDDPELSFKKFNTEATRYCEGISDKPARIYAEGYLAALQQRAQNLEFKEPHNPGLFEPNRNLIRAALYGLYRRYFPSPERKWKTAQSDVLENSGAKG